MSDQPKPDQGNDFSETIQTDGDLLASTTGDFGGLPSDDLHVTISRVPDSDGNYWTDLVVSRPARRLYLIGLLSEAMTLLGLSPAEYVTPGDCPLDYEEPESDDSNPTPV
ncbi:hypothetical protein 2AV2_46 [Nodularia phage vB_NpeS-2AV2]|uniref:Uncharacterized protein n=1 Tax=Nodularia phage vB_NpeS-2AV2 TaxID=1777122 RepID=A0A1L2BWT3_9CAUD|nr:hypothetical protein HWA92_gp046 [Nodularia phage vB_NpeS-2AV2]ALY07498.1 hypothetical protein 2AV2_46 [Nodularia phage vB_NpeS-2AV2]